VADELPHNVVNHDFIADAVNGVLEFVH
jgi:hypothetical protein